MHNKSGLSNTRGNFFIMTGYREDTGTNYRGFKGHGRYMNSGNDVDKIRLQMSSGDISSSAIHFTDLKSIMASTKRLDNGVLVDLTKA